MRNVERALPLFQVCAAQQNREVPAGWMPCAHSCITHTGGGQPPVASGACLLSPSRQESGQPNQLPRGPWDCPPAALPGSRTHVPGGSERRSRAGEHTHAKSISLIGEMCNSQLTKFRKCFIFHQHLVLRHPVLDQNSRQGAGSALGSHRLLPPAHSLEPGGRPGSGISCGCRSGGHSPRLRTFCCT